MVTSKIKRKYRTKSSRKNKSKTKSNNHQCIGKKHGQGQGPVNGKGNGNYKITESCAAPFLFVVAWPSIVPPNEVATI